MRSAEFKAWFEGFTEALDGLPNEAQWKRICERVATIDGNDLAMHFAPGTRSVDPGFFSLQNGTGAPAYWLSLGRTECLQVGNDGSVE